ncbi:phage baseplate protein [Gilliamella apicola]|uniref:phage baseplate protein n=1 Tax=Gilliamella apicola TaxID=1196095 RepID=UPI003987B51F
MTFQSILNKSATNTGLIITEAGTFSLDINTVEQHTSKLRVTENPIENGANIADHAVLDPKEVTVNGLVVSYEVNTPSIDRMLGYDFPEYPLPMEVRTITEQAEKQLRRYYESRNQTIEKTVNNIVADFLPDFQTPSFNNLSSDRISDAYEKLLAIQRSGTPVTLQTNARQYKNMVITSVGLTQKQNTSGEFTITFREVFIVETETVNGFKMHKPKVRNLGRVQPQEVTGEAKRAILERLFGKKPFFG